MARIEKEDLIQSLKAATPENIIFLNWLYANYDNRPAGGGNRRFANVEFLHYTGVIAGCEFLTYAATKLYAAISIVFSNSGVSISAAGCRITFYNMANAVFYYAKNASCTWLTTPATNYEPNNFELKNFWFSRFAEDVYSHIIFNGFRITLN